MQDQLEPPSASTEDKQQAPAVCTCLKDTDTRLGAEGFKLASALKALRMGGSAIKMAWLLPIERKEGKKKRDDPAGVWLEFCPFCGVKLP